jgi:hypothetical protein
VEKPEFLQVFHPVVIPGNHKKTKPFLRPVFLLVVDQLQESEFNNRFRTGTGEKNGGKKEAEQDQGKPRRF